MGARRWRAIAESQFPHEREALEFLRAHLPDHDPWYAWSNFEFIDDQGRVNEVDALILSPRGLFLVEIKSWSGRLTGDTHSWTLANGTRSRSTDNPLRLANRKAKRLASLLGRHCRGAKLPFVDEVIFLSIPGLVWTLDPASAIRTFDRGRPGRSDDDGIFSVLNDGLQGRSYRIPVDAKQAQAICRAVEDSGIRPSLSDRRVSDFQLGKMIAEGDGWQDWEAEHLSLDIRRRIRIHPFPASAGEGARQALVRIASREFEILEGVDHPGVLKVRDFKETERGPALMFDHDPNAVRFDFALNLALERLSVGQRLGFLRQLGETLKYAHEKGVYHRALAPQNILVRDVSAPVPRLQIMNWQTGVREAVTSQSGCFTIATEHLVDHVEDPAMVYVAPEAFDRRYGAGPHHDVFSLGAIAFHLFAGRPPAASPVELVERLGASDGLLISDHIDGASQELVELISFSTHPDVSRRLASMDEFLDYLAEVEREMRRPPPEVTVDPAEAAEGDRIDGGFTVLARLGRGASADALLVRPDGSEEELVLKVALDPSHNDRLRSEGAVLGGLRQHQNIVAIRGVTEVAGRAAILMERAGKYTLAQRLRGDHRKLKPRRDPDTAAPDAEPAADPDAESGDERLSLDLVQRFGEELLDAVDHLEQHGVAHRDIKPENIGVAAIGQTGRLQLVLFDFSLSRTPTDNIRAGTRPYLDPFLSQRRPPRWDLHAERFAATVTLYEMLTGAPPLWGDGLSDPALIEDEATIDSDLFEPNLREGLAAFFSRAFRREPRERFDNAEEMLRAWRVIFDAPRLALAGGDAFEHTARHAAPSTSIAELGYSREAQDVLDRLGIHCVRDLLAVPRRRLRYLSGVGDRVRREIREKAKRLAIIRPDLVPGGDAAALLPPPTGLPSIDQLADNLIPKRRLAEEVLDDRALEVWLGLEPTAADRLWPSIGQVGSHCGMRRAAVAAALAKGRERWKRQPELTAIRAELDELLAKSGGVMTVDELARKLLAMRGSTLEDAALRRRHASAVIRAAAEVEAALETRRFEIFADDAPPLLATAADLAAYARALGEAADSLADRDPLAAPHRAMDELHAIRWPRNEAAPAPARILSLAVAASRRAALSSRQEIYPRAMPAARALRLALGSLMGPHRLDAEQIRERVAGRYPEAEPLPGRPALDALLEEAESGRVWDIVEGRPGYYSRTSRLGRSTGAGALSRFRTDGPLVEQTPQVQAARDLEERFAAARRHGGFLALTVEPRRYLEAEGALLDRYPLRRISFDRLFLDAMREKAGALGVDWSLVLRADAAEETSRDWINLRRLIDRAWPDVEAGLRAETEPLLLVDAGLLGRYDVVDRLQGLRDCAGSRNGPPALWLLLPLADAGLPMIGDKAVPIIGSNQWARITPDWIANRHRAGARNPFQAVVGESFS